MITIKTANAIVIAFVK